VGLRAGPTTRPIWTQALYTPKFTSLPFQVVNVAASPGFTRRGVPPGFTSLPFQVVNVAVAPLPPRHHWTQQAHIELTPLPPFSDLIGTVEPQPVGPRGVYIYLHERVLAFVAFGGVEECRGSAGGYGEGR